MKPAVAVLYADASGAALVDALKRWRSSYAPSLPYEAMFAEAVTSTKVQTTMYPAGHATVHIRIEGRRRGTDDDYWYEATLSGGEMRLVSDREEPSTRT